MTAQANQTPKMPVVRTSHGLRDALFDELDRLINGKSTPAQANAVARIADQIVATVQLEIEVKKIANRNPATSPQTPASLQLGSNPE